jgi:hypothetical protein
MILTFKYQGIGFRRSLRFSVTEKHVTGPSMSVCLSAYRVLYRVATRMTLEHIFCNNDLGYRCRNRYSLGCSADVIAHDVE